MFGTDRALRAPNVLDIDVRRGQDVTILYGSIQNLLLYITTILIWGSSWLAIKLQLGYVDPMVSVAYRFLLASAIEENEFLVHNLKIVLLEN